MDPNDINVMSVAADPDGAEVIDYDRYCPARVPCLGRPAVGVRIPVRQTAGVGVDIHATRMTGLPVVATLTATLCRVCQAWAADPGPDQ